MTRAQLALNVSNLEAAVSFYSKLFAVPPAKVRPGYANFAIAEPPLKLVLIEHGGQQPGSLNHLGIEVGRTEQVAQAHERLTAAGLAVMVEGETECCYALQDKIWVSGPDGEPWEVYTVLADTERPAISPDDERPSGAPCCAGRQHSAENNAENLAAGC